MEPDSHIRHMKPRDLPTVLEIERDCFEHFWDGRDFAQRLTLKKQFRGYVFVIDDVVNGYIVVELRGSDVAIINLAVDPAARRQGIGLSLVHQVTYLLDPVHPALTAAVADYNLEAQKFFAACGLKAVKVLHDFYDSSDSDAYLFRAVRAFPQTAVVRT